MGGGFSAADSADASYGGSVVRGERKRVGPLSVSVSPGQENPPGRREGNGRKNRLSIPVYLDRYLTLRGYVLAHVSTRGRYASSRTEWARFVKGMSLKTFRSVVADHLRRVNSLGSSLFSRI